jgi:hypothetical protein
MGLFLGVILRPHGEIQSPNQTVFPSTLETPGHLVMFLMTAV